MRKIIGIIRPYERFQQFYAYEDNNNIDSINIDMTDINKFAYTLFEFCNKYDIQQINFKGPKQYLRGFVTNLQTIELDKYGKVQLEFNII